MSMDEASTPTKNLNREMIDKLKDLTEFAAHTGDEHYMDIANKLSKDVLLTIAKEEMGKFKAEDFRESAAKTICFELKSAAADDPLAGKAKKSFKVQSDNQLKFFDRAEELLKADGIDATRTLESDVVTMTISW